MQRKPYKYGRGRRSGARMKGRISPSLAVSLLALFFSLGGTGLAASHYLITSKSQIAPKVRAALRGERGLSGSAGPQGPAGAAGATGQQGPQGLQGPGTLDPSNWFYAGQRVTVTSSTPRPSATATCPQNYFPITGGYIVSDPSIEVVSDWQPPETNTWDVDAVLATGGAGGTLEAWAWCAPGASSTG